MCRKLLVLLLFAVFPAQAESLEIADTRFIVNFGAGITADQQEKLRLWLTEVGTAATLLHGSLPRDPIRIDIRNYGSGEAVVFAQVIRSEPQGITFYTDPSRPLDEFVRDWTAYHEISHLFIPFPGRPDIWFSEGLASYYQNVLQYRAGLISEEEAWRKLRGGFERGRQDDANDGMPLGELSARMLQKRAFMRTYWSGALYFVEAEIALREKTRGAWQLDDVLREFGECCLDRGRMNGRELAAEFDAVSGQTIFLPLFEQYVQMNAMPDYDGVLERAGIRITGNHVSFAENYLSLAAHPRTSEEKTAK